MLLFVFCILFVSARVDELVNRDGLKQQNDRVQDKVVDCLKSRADDSCIDVAPIDYDNCLKKAVSKCMTCKTGYFMTSHTVKPYCERLFLVILLKFLLTLNSK